MASVRRVSIAVLAVGAFIGALAGSVPAHARDAKAPIRPVIGRPVARPSAPAAGKQFSVTFAVTRSDTHHALTGGTMKCDPSVNGKLLAHVESFRQGTARLSFLVPVAAQGRLLKVTVTIRYAGNSATRIVVYRVPALPRPAVSVGGSSVAEGNSGTVSLVFPVTLSAPTPQPVTAQYATVDGTATAGTDYTATSGSLTFRPGQTSLSVTVPVIGDLAVEPDETVRLVVSVASNAVVMVGEGTGTITNDDVAARSGHYTGSSSQWQFIAFDVGEGARSISGLFLFADLTCDTPLNSLKGEKLELAGTIPVAADGTFTWDGTGVVSLITIHFTIAGRLTAPGSAAGTFRFVDVTSNEPPFHGAHCWTSDVTWSAS